MKNFKIFFLFFLLVLINVTASIKLSAGFFAEKEVPKIPIIYHKNYNMSFLWLERLYWFDTCKYGKIRDNLIKSCNLSKKSFYVPEIASDETLRQVHPQEYLDSFKKTQTILDIAEINIPILSSILKLLPYCFWNKFILNPMRHAVGGTLLGIDVAIEHRYAINLSGGYHHAKNNEGGGFCFLGDIQLGAQKFLDAYPEEDLLIVDFDAHEGNGHKAALGTNPRVHILDIYNGDIYPQDVASREGVEFDCPIRMYTEDEEYLELVRAKIKEAIEKTKPGFVIYNAGTDIFEEDPLGGLKISEEGIIERDEIVFQACFENDIPVLMLLSGGYTPESAGIVSRSIENLLKNVVPERIN